MPLPHGMVGIYGVVASANHMPVWGGVESLLGTNPVAVAIPAGEEAPIVLDIATSVVSYGTVKSHRLQGKPMPEGWMVNTKDGTPLTDPARSGEGVLLPIGGYKGSGLALVLGLLAGPLNGAAFGRDVFDFNYNDTDVCNTGHFIVALDVKRFTPLDTFKAEMDRHLRDLRTSKPLPGVDAVRLPGQERRTRRADRLDERRAAAARTHCAARYACRRARHQAARRAVSFLTVIMAAIAAKLARAARNLPARASTSSTRKQDVDRRVRPGDDARNACAISSRSPLPAPCAPARRPAPACARPCAISVLRPARR